MVSDLDVQKKKTADYPTKATESDYIPLSAIPPSQQNWTTF